MKYKQPLAAHSEVAFTRRHLTLAPTIALDVIVITLQGRAFGISETFYGIRAKYLLCKHVSHALLH